MANISGKELVKMANLAGFSPARKTKGIGHDRWMAAIILAESAGNPKAHNKVPPDNSYGLAQINMIGQLGPARRKEFGIKSNNELFEPMVNLKAAYKVYKGAGYSFSPWSTYPSAASLQLPKTAGVPLSEREFFYEGREDIERILGDLGEGLGDIEDVLNSGELAKKFPKDKLGESLTGLADPFTFLTDWIGGYALRVGAFVGGGVLLVLALLMVMGKSSTVGGAAKTAARAVT